LYYFVLLNSAFILYHDRQRLSTKKLKKAVMIIFQHFCAICIFVFLCPENSQFVNKIRKKLVNFSEKMSFLKKYTLHIFEISVK